MYDILIIGAGPAGLTSAIYAKRAEKSVVVLEQGGFGGQITHSPKIENYPGFESVSGNELADKMVEQAISQGVDFEMTKAIGIDKNGKHFTVHTEDGDFESKAVIIATGAKHRQLKLDKEDSLEGISYCAVCDGAFYKGKDVCVIGGGNSALQEALLLSDLCASVTVIQNLSFLTGEASLQNRIRSKSNVRVIFSTVVTALKSKDDSLSAITVKNTDSGAESDIETDGMFVCIGLAPENSYFASLSALDEVGYIISDEKCTTSTDGLFCAGDCRTKAVRQIATAVSDGAIAALGAIRYCDGN